MPLYTQLAVMLTDTFYRFVVYIKNACLYSDSHANKEAQIIPEISFVIKVLRTTENVYHNYSKMSQSL
jgi:hypothetical protein